MLFSNVHTPLLIMVKNSQTHLVKMTSDSDSPMPGISLAVIRTFAKGAPSSGPGGCGRRKGRFKAGVPQKRMIGLKDW